MLHKDLVKNSQHENECNKEMIVQKKPISNSIYDTGEICKLELYLTDAIISENNNKNEIVHYEFISPVDNHSSLNDNADDSARNHQIDNDQLNTYNRNSLSLPSTPFLCHKKMQEDPYKLETLIAKSNSENLLDDKNELLNGVNLRLKNDNWRKAKVIYSKANLSASFDANNYSVRSSVDTSDCGFTPWKRSLSIKLRRERKVSNA